MQVVGKKSDKIKVIARNKRAEYLYTIFDKWEAGIVLSGAEVKGVREGKIAFKDSYVEPINNELYIVGLHISPVNTLLKIDPDRKRKLLLHRREINKIIGRITEKGYTVIPLSIYIKNNLVKVQIGLAKGKRKYDKKEKIKQRDLDREMRILKW
ncbi:MAG: SsrA-binding protein SmpB [Caldisericia bacterium]|jgi:SsrA-binding protein|nr:SsrA-binding protein SmpB [Caldisericia bacterium]MDD3427970.1 SsrA-binding protein SmpB [Caldisericia bacterium]MDD5688780.1 SsrA-binding protein SmpB [Caldisericia bacterium]HOJ15565.1 SsrA-binding protein SmpB [Caldisericia bacterium]HOW02745.1 SsrA-binding protein SmpB [Caldisericia bacterium]